MVGTVTNGSSTGWALTANSVAVPGYDLNPGNNQMFPWLSRVAVCYEKYHFKSLRFILVSNQSSATNGRVTMAVDYDWDDNVPTTKSQLSTYSTLAEGPVWEPELVMDCDPSLLASRGQFLYVVHPTRADPEPRTVYGGFLVIATDTPTANLSWDLYAEYAVELQSPQIDMESAYSNYDDVVTTGVSDLFPSTGSYKRHVPRVSPQSVLASQATTMPVVTPGSGGVPNLMLDTTTVAQQAFDISKQWRGVLDWCATIYATGVSPTNFLSYGALANALIYTGAGTLLGNVVTALGAKARRYGGPRVPSELASAGCDYEAHLSTTIDAIRTYFPQAKYLVPFVESSTLVAAGGSALRYLSSLTL